MLLISTSALFVASVSFSIQAISLSVFTVVFITFLGLRILSETERAPCRCMSGIVRSKLQWWWNVDLKLCSRDHTYCLYSPRTYLIFSFTTFTDVQREFVWTLITRTFRIRGDCLDCVKVVGCSVTKINLFKEHLNCYRTENRNDRGDNLITIILCWSK